MNYCIFGVPDHVELIQLACPRYTRFKPQESSIWEIRMAKKKKVRRFRAVTAVKELARERVGEPPAGQIVIERKRKPEKHKPTLGKLLDETD